MPPANSSAWSWERGGDKSSGRWRTWFKPIRRQGFFKDGRVSITAGRIRLYRWLKEIMQSQKNGQSIHTDPWLEKFRKEALPLIIHEIQPENVLAFGSRARGTANEESDLDIIIISRQFRGIPFLELMPMILNRVPFVKHVDYLCYTPEEFRKVKQTSSILIDALSDPLELAVS